MTTINPLISVSTYNSQLTRESGRPLQNAPLPTVSTFTPDAQVEKAFNQYITNQLGLNCTPTSSEVSTQQFSFAAGSPYSYSPASLAKTELWQKSQAGNQTSTFLTTLFPAGNLSNLTFSTTQTVALPLSSKVSCHYYADHIVSGQPSKTVEIKPSQYLALLQRDLPTTNSLTFINNPRLYATTFTPFVSGLSAQLEDCSAFGTAIDASKFKYASTQKLYVSHASNQVSEFATTQAWVDKNISGAPSIINNGHYHIAVRTDNIHDSDSYGLYMDLTSGIISVVSQPPGQKAQITNYAPGSPYYSDAVNALENSIHDIAYGPATYEGDGYPNYDWSSKPSVSFVPALNYLDSLPVSK